MAEQFRRTYISVSEFIDSWEKEIYELTNLDYFSYLLINELASTVEQDFFARKKFKPDDALLLNDDEISTLAFNIGDSLQNFFEKNCFSICNLNCPCQLDVHLKPEDRACNREVKNHFRIQPESKETKEFCLSSDILNYVVLDSIIDFYNYELGIILNESDNNLLDLAEFILNKIVHFVRFKGQRFLENHTENASNYFDDLIQSDESSWQPGGVDYDSNDDEDEETESWKMAYSGIENVLDEFIENYQQNNPSAGTVKLITKFKEYLSDFLELGKIDDLTMDDLEEFICVVLPNEMILEDITNFDDVNDAFVKLLTYLEFNHNVFLKIPYLKFSEREFPEIMRTFKLTHTYQSSFPLINFLLASGENTDESVEGFFEITGHRADLCQIKDIHLKTIYEQVDFSKLNEYKLKKGDILHLQIEKIENRWKIAHVEMVYPQAAKYYLY